MGERKGRATALTPGDKPRNKGAPGPKERGKKKEEPGLAFLSLTALGVVYGDIGTSPLYAIRECFKPQYGLAPTEANVLGIISLVLWSLLLVVGVKYVIFVLRADFDGEGGILALVGLTEPDRDALPRWTINGTLLALGVFGAALLYGDAIITPAISVMSAVEGLRVITPSVQSYVVPIAAGILLALFLFEQRGTAGVGKLFGPIMTAWFLTLAVLGIIQIAGHPGVLAAANPWQAALFFQRHGVAAWLVLGAVVLAVTGAEALFADIGHFGTRSIRLTWYAFVLPSLVLDYLGQGALLLHDRRAVDYPFFHQVSGWGLYPLVALATVATVIASQAVISGVFSLTQQAIQLGYSPRMTIRHTSPKMEGQIYLPAVNYALMAGCLALVFGFQSSTNLAAAYGMAVSGTMAVTTVLFSFIAHRKWKWPLVGVIPLGALFLVVDLAFLSSNMMKLLKGGWLPLTIAAVIFFLAITWKHGSKLLRSAYRRRGEPLDEFVRRVRREKIARPDETAVFLAAQKKFAPLHLVAMEQQVHALPRRVVILVVSFASTPRVRESERCKVEELPDGFVTAIAEYGYRERPEPVEILQRLQELGAKEPLDTGKVSYLIHQEAVVAGPGDGIAHWRKQIYAFMYRNARSPAEFFGLPQERILEIGSRTEL